MNFRMLQLGSTLFLISFLLGVSVPRCDDPEQLCNAAAEISAKTELRCGSTRTLEEGIQAFKDQVAFGDCRMIKTVRDSAALINDCLPWLSSVSCQMLEQGRVLPACLNQFFMTVK